MNADEFNAWLEMMKAAGLARTSYEAAALLGLRPNTISVFAKRGCDRRTALACRYLLHFGRSAEGIKARESAEEAA